jgi:hypothetical protein
MSRLINICNKKEMFKKLSIRFKNKKLSKVPKWVKKVEYKEVTVNKSKMIKSIKPMIKYTSTNQKFLTITNRRNFLVFQN